MYPSLQAGRAAAAALVVLFHLGGTFAQDKYFAFKALDGPFAWGDAGVEFFFVLSGFLITFTHRREFGHPRALPGYLKKRLLRIYPTYWLVCIAVCIAAIAVPALRQAVPSDAWVLVKALALVPQDPAVVGGTGAPILFVAWSLQYEMMFYGVLALAVLNRGAGVLAALALVLVHLSCSFGTRCEFPRSFLGNNLIFVFGFGVAAAFLVKPRRFRIPQPLAVGIAAIVAFVAFGLFEVAYGRDRLPIDRRLVYGLLGAVVILALVQAEDRGLLAMKQRWIKVLGDASYALYLLHIPIISVVCKLWLKLGLTSPVAIVAAFVLTFLLCIGGALLFHLTIERRLLALFRPRRGSDPAAAPRPSVHLGAQR